MSSSPPASGAAWSSLSAAGLSARLAGEEPVEITQEGLRQVQVNRKVGFDFAAAMRTFLRADPDVIMVGKMRDHETAQTAMEASLTGHLVLSTLHTNNAPETVTRLLDMGLESFSFADSLLGILAQRLVRRLCPECRQPDVPGRTEQEAIEGDFGGRAGLARAFSLEDGAQIAVWGAPGCEACEGTGYKEGSRSTSSSSPTTRCGQPSRDERRSTRFVASRLMAE